MSAYALIGILLFVGLTAYLSRRPLSLAAFETEAKAKTIKNAWRRGRLLPPFLLLILGLLVLSQHHRRELFTEGTNLVETGCYWLADYRYEMLLEHLHGRYEYFYSKGRHDNVIFSAGKKYRELSVSLKGSPYLDNIRKLAPVAVDEYFREIKKSD